MRTLRLHHLYKHFKGNIYITEDLCVDSETGKYLVLYRALYGKPVLYARDLDMFLSEVDHEKYPDVLQKYRFEEYMPGE